MLSGPHAVGMAFTRSVYDIVDAVSLHENALQRAIEDSKVRVLKGSGDYYVAEREHYLASHGLSI